MDLNPIQIVLDSVESIVEGFFASIPQMIIALIVLVMTLIIGRVIRSIARRLMQGARVRAVAQQQFQGLSRPLLDLATELFETGAANRIREDVLAVIRIRVAKARAVLADYGIVARDLVPFIWVPMPRGWRASTFVQAAETQGIRIKAADEFCLVDGWAPNAVRLAIVSEPSESRFEEALVRIADLLDNPPHDLEV